MKFLATIAAMLALCSIGFSAEMTVRYEERTETICTTDANGKTRCVPVTRTVPVVYSTAPKTSAVSLVTVPPGHHAHKMADGSTMIHADSNYGDPVAHEGVVGRNWPKTAVAGQTVSISADVCPSGTCPGSASVSSSSMTSSTIRESIRSGGGFFRRLFSFKRLRGLAGGCP